MLNNTIAGYIEINAGDQASYQAQVQQLFNTIAANSEQQIFIRPLCDDAKQAAINADQRRQNNQALGQLDGIPVAIKDNIHYAGSPTTAGTQYDFSGLFSEDAAVVERLKNAGAIVIGKLNMDEGALGATTRNRFWGQCENPRLPGRTPGGSSGGSAAAVAAGNVPLSLGSDTLGSVRIPAAYCGVWGLKPTKGLVSSYGVVSLSTTLDSIGPLANCAEDLALAIKLLAGPDARDPQSITPPQAYVADIDQFESLEGVRLGVLDWRAQIKCETLVQHGFESLLDAAREMGAQVTSVTLDSWQATQARRAGLLIAEAECASWLLPIIEKNDGAFSDEFKAMIEYGGSVSGEKLSGAYQYVDELKQVISSAMEPFDGLIMPTVPQQAFPQAGPVPENQADFTALANFGNCTAVAFPINSGTTPVPVSVQVMGPAFCETKVLGIARLLSQLHQR